MKKILVVLLLAVSFLASAQEQEKKQAVEHKFYGWIRTDLFWDSRDVAGAREDLFNLYPATPLMDNNGVDVRARKGFNFTSASSRFGWKMKGPDAFGAKLTANLEGGFTGLSETTYNLLRLRVAIVKLNWGKDELMIGQYWHPMFTTVCFPTVESLNTGAPFNPFGRAPQIRYTRSQGKFKLIAAALTQRDFVTIGPDGKSSEYIRSTATPNFHAQLRFHGSKKFVAGVAYDLKSLHSPIPNDTALTYNKDLTTTSLMAFAAYKGDRLTVKAKAVIGQNFTEGLMLGGYGLETSVDSTQTLNFKPLNTSSYWLNILYGKKVQGGLFLGYAKNHGSDVELNPDYVWGRGLNIESLMRIAPAIRIRSGKFMFGAEVEQTILNYGTANAKMHVDDPSRICNTRLLFTTWFFF